jgi:hypothetical protein
MHSKPLIPLLLAAALAVTACGSSGGGGGGGGHRSRSVGRPLRTYRVQLTGAAARPAGASHGTGAAVIALHHRAVVCFRFAHLRGFTGATTAEIGLGPKGHPGTLALQLSRSRALRHSGCVRATRRLAAALQRSPSAYFVVINSKQYPRGAIRGQL